MSLVKLHWLVRCKKTAEFHKEHLRKDKKWTMSDTATLLNRSAGSVCEDLLIAQWLNSTIRHRIERCRSMRDALELVREHKNEVRLQ